VEGIERFSFVGMGESEQGELAPVSERHDEALEEAFERSFRRPACSLSQLRRPIRRRIDEAVKLDRVILIVRK